MDIIDLVGTGITMGIIHVLTGPDHLSAVATLSANMGTKAGFKYGIKWGMGHSLGIIFVGSILIGIHNNQSSDNNDQDTIVMPEWLSILGESLVGIFMLFIGMWGFKLAFQNRNRRRRQYPSMEYDSNKNLDTFEDDELLMQGIVMKEVQSTSSQQQQQQQQKSLSFTRGNLIPNSLKQNDDLSLSSTTSSVNSINSGGRTSKIRASIIEDDVDAPLDIERMGGMSSIANSSSTHDESSSASLSNISLSSYSKTGTTTNTTNGGGSGGGDDGSTISPTHQSSYKNDALYHNHLCFSTNIASCLMSICCPLPCCKRRMYSLFQWQCTKQFVSFGIGIIHGIAGPGGVLGVIPAIQLQDWTKSMTYLTIFCITSTLTMGTYGSCYGTCTSKVSQRSNAATTATNSSSTTSSSTSGSNHNMEFRIELISSLLSIIVGIVWLVLISMGKLDDIFP